MSNGNDWRRWMCGLLGAIATLLVAGCATTDENNVSSIPWNRPQNWEGTGALGGFQPPGSGGGGYR